jgi:hypothetical protein
MAERRLSAEQMRLAVLLVVLAVVVTVAVSRMIRHGGLAETRAARETTEYQTRDLPRLAEITTVDGSEVDALTSRNPFTFGAPPTPTRNLTPPPTRVPLPTRPPRPTPTPRTYIGEDGNVMGPPPPFNRKYIGYFGPLSLRVAAFRSPGDEPGTVKIDVGVEGEVLEDKFIIREIGLESVIIGFVGYDSSEDTRVPLADD